MQGLDIFLVYCERFSKAEIPYMVTGSVASILYGEPRLTHDIDLVIFTPELSPELVLRSFPQTEFYCPPPEVILVESKRASRGHFNLIHHESGFKADVYFAGNDSFAHWAYKHTNKIHVRNHELVVAPPEWVIFNKLLFYREGISNKHLDDIRGILANDALKINWEVLKSQIALYNLEREFEKVSA